MTQSKSESKSNVNTAGATIPDFCPWSHCEYSEDYDRAFVHICHNQKVGHTTRLNQVVEYVYSADYSDTQYQRISRFTKDCGYLKVKSLGGYSQIEPIPEAFDILLESAVSVSQKQQTATGLDSDDLEDNISDTDTTESYPKDRLKSLLNKRLRLNAEDHADYRSEILTQLAIYRSNILGTCSIHKHRVREKQYLSIPNTTRFTDKTDASNSEKRLREALDNAKKDFDHGVVVTLTIDPKRFETHSEATDAIKGARQNLIQTLDYQVGEYPTQITTPDFQSETGLLHYHIPLFGISKVSESQNETGEATISESQIREYWSDKYDIGSQISIQRTWTRNGEWLLHRDDKTVSLRYYLGKRIRELQKLSDLDGGSLPLKYWRHALFWVYDLQYVSCSESLKDDTEDSETGISGLPKTTEWEYIGTARYDQIPSHIWENMIFVGTPP